MQKGWFCVLLIMYIVVFSSSGYSKLSDSEKSKFESCPIGTYVGPFGDSLKNYSCYEIELKQNASNFLSVNTLK